LLEEEDRNTVIEACRALVEELFHYLKMDYEPDILLSLKHVQVVLVCKALRISSVWYKICKSKKKIRTFYEVIFRT
jgi:hypothetical protein